MQMKRKYGWTKHLDFMIVDMIALLLSFVIAYYIKFDTIHVTSEWRRLIVIVGLLNIVISLAVNPYSGIFRRPFYQEISRTFFLVGSNALSATLFFYVLKIGATYSREVVIYTYLLYFFLSIILKYIWKKHLTSKTNTNETRKPPLFLVSEIANVEQAIHDVCSGDIALYEIKGIHFPENHLNADEQTRIEKRVHELLGEDIQIVEDGIVKFILDHNIDEVLIAAQPNRLDQGIYKELIANGIGVNMVIESTIGFQTEEQLVTDIGIYKTLSVRSFSFTPAQCSYMLVKRFIDIICGLIGLVILLPVTAFVKLAYLLTGDTANVLYQQNRIGLNGKKIKIWKYRSMVPNAEEILQEMLKDERYRKEWEENQKFENDPRITKVGKFLRKTSIDELPQMINVFLGTMSLVGPRPLVEGELEAHQGLKLYQKVKPGITGWWGCNGRSNIDYRERLELEYYYVRNCSFHLDLLCVIRTLYAVLKKDGAQ